ncbi:MAG: Na+/H+ antiporter NhaC family protein [Clostridia bacterium]|nr:Na+/H+ antiporter NhaC family protein [Clostridia bacterium]
MLNQKKFFNKKTLSVLIAGVIILTLLIVLTATDAVHKLVTCSTCSGTGFFLTEACEACAELADKSACTECSGTGIVPKICEMCGGATVGVGTIWALLPPIIAIGLALITKEVFSSLFIGILSGAILANDFNPVKSVDTVVSAGLIDAVAGTAGIFIFLIELGVLVCLVNKAGGSRAFGEWAQKHVKTRVGAAICTFVLGVLIFIDDYFNCLTVGSVMRPVTDKHKISRSKLAYLIDATAAPICMIAPISSWAAAVSKYAANGQGINLFIMAIPFNFYSLLTIIFVIALILMKFDFGPMRKHEENAINGDLFSGARVKGDEDAPNSNGKVIDLILPIVFLLVASIFALVYVGGMLDGLSFADALSATDATVALPWGGLVALIVTIIYLSIRKMVTFKESMDMLPKGFIAMVPAILILTFATALKNVTGLLGADFYIGSLMAQVPEVLKSLLPAIIFVVACILAFATGTSWGTFGILIPIVMAMYPTQTAEPLYIVGISACLAGAVCGDHCSPISDTTIMSSAGAECEHLNHVTTQIPYAVYVAIVSFISFIIAGFIPNALIALPIAIAILIGSLFVTRHVTNKIYAKKEVAEVATADTTDDNE